MLRDSKKGQLIPSRQNSNSVGEISIILSRSLRPNSVFQFLMIFVLLALVVSRGSALVDRNEGQGDSSFLLTIDLSPSFPAASMDDSFASQTQAPLDEIIRHANVLVKPSYYQELASRNLIEVIRLCERQLQLIKDNLIHTIHGQVLARVLSDPTFSIVLVPFNDPELTLNGKFYGAGSRYLPSRNQILIGIDTDADHEEILRTLRNGLFLAGIRENNYRTQVNPKKNLPAIPDTFLMFQPFIRDEWKIDSRLKKQHSVALAAGFQRVQELKSLLSQSSSLASEFFSNPDKSLRLKEYLKIVAKYKPITYVDEIPKEEFKQMLKSAVTTKDDRLAYEYPDKTIYISSVRQGKDVYTLRFSYLKSDQPREKAKALIMDLEWQQLSIDTHYPLPNQETGLSSSLQEMEPTVLEGFFPEWCQFFSESLQAKNYCQI